MMTDKQIIIDASKCEWRTGVEHCGDYECMLNKCCDYNCDWYKRRKFEQQLKRKEKECDKLKNWVKNKMFDTDREDWFEHFVECFEEWKEDLFKQLDQLKAENDKFKQTLIEIQQDLEYATYCESQECGCDDANECLECIKKQLLQKISDCEVEND